ncbi:MAG: hypothetical protein Q9P01_19245 [Anaerolineae bacterium]|nr:hypothetical protein [Anaerolineae bacterium]MDQ7036888.1 hypothetical protein [Anaerolineae bacterium]
MTRTQGHPVRRGFLLLLVLIIVLVVLNLMYPLAAEWQGTLSGEVGDILYAAGFDGFTDEWQQYDGRNSAQISDGVLRISVATAPAIYSAAAPIVTDFDVSVTTRSIEGELENEGYGIIFRLQEQVEGCNRAFVLACGLAEIPLIQIPARYFFSQQNTGATGYHVFLISNDGYYSIWTSNADNQLQAVTVWHNSNGLINEGLGTENRLRVVGRGDEFRFYINGEAVELCIPLAGEQPTGSAAACMGEQSFVWRNDTLQSGQLGLVVNVQNVVGIVVEFDNFTVSSPKGELAEGEQL